MVLDLHWSCVRSEVELRCFRTSQVGEAVRFGGSDSPSLLFADDVVSSTPSSSGEVRVGKVHGPKVQRSRVQGN